MIDKIHSAIKSGNGDAILYATAIGLLISDIVPTPADAAYFYTERKLRQRFEAGEISARRYWTLDTLAYYGYNPIWWGLFLAAIVATKGDYTQKAKIGLAMLGAGVVIAVIHKNIVEESRK